MLRYLMVRSVKHDISFDGDGSIAIGNDVPEDIANIIKDYRLDTEILNEERKKYLEHHKKLFDEKNK